MSMPTPVDVTFEELLERARQLASGPERVVLGITGAPGAGKSTLAEQLVSALGPELAVLVPMDGFHLADAVLHDLGRHERKGAEDTFDVGGYLSLLQRIHAQRSASDPIGGATIYAPLFRRDLEDPIGSAIPIDRAVPLIITEGNYLLLQEHPWTLLRPSFGEVWFLSPAEEQRLEWLVNRHLRYGRSLHEARARTQGSDQRNAEKISSTARYADWVIRVANA